MHPTKLLPLALSFLMIVTGRCFSDSGVDRDPQDIFRELKALRVAAAEGSDVAKAELEAFIEKLERDKRVFLKKNRERVNRVTIKMKALHAAFKAYMLDNGGRWPQVVPGEDESIEEYFARYTKILEPYGVTLESWSVPGKEFLFLPSYFDDRPLTPYRWQQPWLVCVASIGEEGGSLKILPGGEIEVFPFDIHKGQIGHDDPSPPRPAPEIPEEMKVFLPEKTGQ